MNNNNTIFNAQPKNSENPIFFIEYDWDIVETLINMLEPLETTID